MTENQFSNIMAAQVSQADNIMEEQAREGLQSARPGMACKGETRCRGGGSSGTLQPCNLGRDKMKIYKKWSDWIKEAKTKMNNIDITTNSMRLARPAQSSSTSGRRK